MSWEREMIDACCDPTCYHMQRNKAFREARAACIAELLSDPQNDSDLAYDRAVRDCVSAIEGLIKHQVAPPTMPTDDEIRLAAGEMTAQEMRTAKAVLGWFIQRVENTAASKGKE